MIRRISSEDRKAMPEASDHCPIGLTSALPQSQPTTEPAPRGFDQVLAKAYCTIAFLTWRTSPRASLSTFWQQPQRMVISCPFMQEKCVSVEAAILYYHLSRPTFIALHVFQLGLIASWLVYVGLGPREAKTFDETRSTSGEASLHKLPSTFVIHVRADGFGRSFAARRTIGRPKESLVTHRDTL